jgi:hypothetical protein
VSAAPASSARSAPSIATLADLRTHLQWAIELEHATLPPYLCALYSLDPERNPDAVEVLGGVFAEEMLHLALAANILNAVGGRPRLDSPTLLPGHPRRMPHGDRTLELSLLPFGPEALEMFLRVERPAPPHAPEQADRYATIGQFYEAIEDGLRELCARLGEPAVFSGDPARQVSPVHFRHSTGSLITVDSLATALAAMQEIVDEGEGAGRGEVWDGDADVFHPGRAEVSHYYRFQELTLGRRYQPGDTPQIGPTGEPNTVDFTGVLPMRPNPRLSDHPPGHPIRIAQEEFNRTYCTLLDILEQAFNGEPAKLATATRTMFAVKAQAQALMHMPDGAGRTASPSFDYVAPGLRNIGANQDSIKAADGGR